MSSGSERGAWQTFCLRSSQEHNVYNVTFVDGRPMLPRVEFKLYGRSGRSHCRMSLKIVGGRTFLPPCFKNFFERARLNTATRSARPLPKQCVSTVRPCPVPGTRLNIFVSTLFPHCPSNKGHRLSSSISPRKHTHVCIPPPPYLTAVRRDQTSSLRPVFIIVMPRSQCPLAICAALVTATLRAAYCLTR